MRETIDGTSVTVHDPHAERAYLGLLLLFNAHTDPVPRVFGEMFYLPIHRVIFDAACDVIAEMGDEWRHVARLDFERVRTRVIGAFDGDVDRMNEYLERCVESFDVPYLWSRYEKPIVDTYRERRIAGIMARVSSGAELGRSVEDMISEIEDEIADMRAVHGEQVEAGSISEVVASLMDSMVSGKPVETFPTWLHSLNEMLGGGVSPGQLVVIGARPSHGKSIVCGNMLRALAEAGIPSLMISTEMSKTQCVMRQISDIADIEMRNLKNQNLTSEEQHRIEDAAVAMDGWPGEIRQLTTEGAILSAIRAAVCNGTRVVILDYLQRVAFAGDKARWEQIGQFTGKLKQIALENDVLVVAAAQLNRENQKRTNTRPKLSDLRESGDIEQDADIVVLLHKFESDAQVQIDLIIEKNREGETGVIQGEWCGQYMRIEERKLEFATQESIGEDYAF